MAAVVAHKKGASSSVVTFRAILFSEKTWDGQLDGSCQMFQNLTPFPLLLKYYRHLYIKPHILLRCDIRVLKMVDQPETLSTRWDKNDYHFPDLLASWIHDPILANG